MSQVVTNPAVGNTVAKSPAQTLVDKQMQKALAQHQAGKLKDAEEYYRQVLRLHPEHPDANNLLGVLLFQSNRAAEGLANLDRAVNAKPQESMFLYNYGIALRAVGDQNKALEVFERCIRQDAKQVDALWQLVEIYQKRHAWDRAIELLRHLSGLKPEEVRVHRSLGETLHNAKKFVEASVALTKASQLAPTDATIFHLLGLSLQASEKIDEAIAAYKKSLELKSDLAPSLNNLAILLAEKGKHEEAIQQYETALGVNPKLFQTKCNLGGLLRKIGRLEESAEWLRSAVEQKPDCAEAWCNLGNTLGDQGNAAEAMKCYRTAILHQPDYPQARLNRALGLLRLEDFDNGWLEYEWRWKLKECPRRSFPKPRWDGSPPNGRTLLVHAEQGLGDTIQLSRYAKYLKDQGHRVVMECQKAIVPLMTENKVADEIVGLGQKLPEFDLHLPLMSLPSVLFSSIGFGPSSYLDAKPELVDKWRERLSSLSGKKIGIFWQGNPEFKQDKFRSIPLENYLPLLRMPGMDFVSLQKGFGSEQIKNLPDDIQVHQFEDMDTESGAFMDTAAILKNLDLVVTSDSAVVHLAGALGVKTFLALPWASDWRWFAKRSDCPWYPSMTLFRQSERENWPIVFQALAQAVLDHFG